MSYFSQEIGGYANDSGCAYCLTPTSDLSPMGACRACRGEAPVERKPYVPPAEYVERLRLQLAGRKLKAYRTLLVMAIERSIGYTHRLDDRLSEAAAGTAVMHATVAAHNAFILRPDLCPRGARVAA